MENGSDALRATLYSICGKQLIGPFFRSHLTTIYAQSVVERPFHIVFWCAISPELLCSVREYCMVNFLATQTSSGLLRIAWCSHEALIINL